LLGIWAKFYECDYFPTYDELLIKYDYTDNSESGETNDKKYYFSKASVYREPWFFDIDKFKKRMKISIQSFLFDAKERGKAATKKVFCHVVGLGLGVWQVCPNQPLWFVETLYEVLKNDFSGDDHGISDIHFSWFPDDLPSKPDSLNNQIKISFSKRNPADQLTGDDEGKLIVAMYAWDGNSFPGNEYWCGMLTASGDPAAACCSTIPELQNPLVNPFLLENIWTTNESKALNGCTYVKNPFDLDDEQKTKLLKTKESQSGNI